MSNLYSILFIILSTAGLMSLVFVIRWVNDANCTGWRLRRWHERSVFKYDREWQPWFAWRPVKTVSGQRIWWDTVYRKLGNDYTDQEDFSWYYYGTVLDVLKETQ